MQHRSPVNSGIEEMESAVVCYREYAPRAALRAHIRAFFSFVPADGTGSPRRHLTREVRFAAGESFSAPLFADASTSIVFDLGTTCGTNGVWGGASDGAPRSRVIGAMSHVGASGPTSGLPAMVGVYFHPARATAFMRLPLSELTDRIATVADVWGAAATDLPDELDALDEAARIDRLERELERQFEHQCGPRTSIDVPGIAECVSRSGGRASIAWLADAAGVSRQRLARVFREAVGVSPKVFSRLARFRAALAYAGAGEQIAWAPVAAALGYADQSHMIADFREFSSLTPQQLASGRVFHPFIERLRRAPNPDAAR